MADPRFFPPEVLFAGLYDPEPAVDPRLPFPESRPVGADLVDGLNGLPRWLLGQKGPLGDLGRLPEHAGLPPAWEMIPQLAPIPELLPNVSPEVERWQREAWARDAEPSSDPPTTWVLPPIPFPW